LNVDHFSWVIQPFLFTSRERNRQTAKLNRDRKKEETRELQDTVQYLRRQNQSLQSELNRRPSYLAAGQQLLVSFGKDFTSRVVSALETLRARAESNSGAFYVINAASHFFPVVFASPAFVELTGYSMQEIIGQNCGFLSGLQTSRNEVRINISTLLLQVSLLLTRQFFPPVDHSESA